VVVASTRQKLLFGRDPKRDHKDKVAQVDLLRRST
jgi:hypothetical protein